MTAVFAGPGYAFVSASPSRYRSIRSFRGSASAGQRFRRWRTRRFPGHTRHWQEKLKGKKAQTVRTVYAVGTASRSRQGVNGIYRRVAMSAFDQGLVEMPIAKVEEAARALSSHSLRVGLTQDLFAAGEEGVGIAQALR